MSDLELAVRTIEELLPDMPTKAIQKWLGILNTAAVKCEQELASTMMHRCGVCGSEEYGYRTEMPVGWREKGDLVICFNHEDDEVAKLLKEAIATDTEESETNAEETLDELMALI